MFYQDKYKACVVKIQLACTFLLDVVLFTGPHFGVESDGQLGIDHISTLPLASWEKWLADGPYYVCDKLICPHRKQRIPGSHPPRFAPLTPREIVENNLQSEARSPIEHLNAYVEHHAMFEGRKYRGDLEYLRHFITITVHFTALYIRHGYGRRSGHGPWPHTG